MIQEIQEFNQALLTVNDDITIIEYVKMLNDKFFKIDIDFIDDFIELVKKDECCIHHDMLYKYGVLTENETTTNNVKRLLEQNDFKDIQHYSLLNERLNNSREKCTYLLHPKSFKKILMRSRKQDKYADYFLLLEEAITYYNDFQIMKLQNKLKEVQKKSILDLEKFNTLENFIIFRTRDPKYKYGIIRGTNENVREVKADLRIDEEDIIEAFVVPHASNFWKRIREKLENNFVREHLFENINTNEIISERKLNESNKELYKFYAITRNFCLIDITIEDFINKIKEINNERFE